MYVFISCNDEKNLFIIKLCELYLQSIVLYKLYILPFGATCGALLRFVSTVVSVQIGVVVLFVSSFCSCSKSFLNSSKNEVVDQAFVSVVIVYVEDIQFATNTA
jgi:hypothetical protein